MSEIFQCGDHGALIAYLYDECAPEEREIIAAHLSQCVSCAGEITGLTSTRQALAAWAPPAIDLGLQITRKTEAEVLAPAAVLAFRPPQSAAAEGAAPSWWKAPLPAWAQAAAAVAIFAAGLAVGAARTAPAAGGAQSAASPAPVLQQPASTPSKADLAQLEQRLRSEMAQLVRNTATNTPPQAVPVSGRSSDDAIIQRVQALIAQSEERQRVEFTERTVRQASSFEAQRRADLETVRATFGQFQGTTSAEVRQQRQAIDEINRYLVRVSQQR
jgi:hypothetical protein